jgi:hypothetical protein
MISAVAAICSAWLLGVLAVSALWPGTRSRAADFPVILALGIGMGLGITSALFFAASLLSTEPLWISAGLELAVGAGLAGWLWRRRAKQTADVSSATGNGAGTPTLFQAVVASIFVQALVVAGVVSARAYAAEPSGGWDGWAIWNMHARFIFRGGEDWAGLLRQPPLAWTHLDYPLLVPASVARVWAWVGRDATWASGLVSALLGLATVGLLTAAAARLRPGLVALTGGLVLLGTPFFVTFASNQHADIPLGFFFLATVVCLAFGRDGPESAGLPAVAGFAAGMAAWTKNEGLLFVAVVVGVWGIHAWARGTWRGLGGLLGGLAVALVPLLYFKAVIAPPNDVVSGEMLGRLGNLWDGSRHRLILASFWRDLLRFGEWSVVPFLAMIPPLLGPGWRRWRGVEWIVAAIIALMLAGYYAVYLLTPWNLAWHLDFSLVRLLLQLWPAGIFFWCLAVTGVEPAAVADEARPTRGMRWPGFLAANLVVAGLGLMAFSRQLAPNQFDVARAGGGEVSAIIGDGWFGRETDGRSSWVWSKGESTLFLRVKGQTAATAATLRFGVRGLGERTVAARIGDRILWQGPVKGELSRVELAGLLLPPGVTTITFTTSAPGVPESAEKSARALSFALYDVRLQ